MKLANNNRPFAITIVKSEGVGKNLRTVSIGELSLKAAKGFIPIARFYSCVMDEHSWKMDFCKKDSLQKTNSKSVVPEPAREHAL